MLCSKNTALKLYFLLATLNATYSENFVVVSTTEAAKLEQSNVEKFSKLESEIQELKTQIQELQLLLRKQENSTVNLQTQLDHFEDKSLPKNCQEIKNRGDYITGVYTIRPKSEKFNVLCDMNTQGGGWTVFQRRLDGSQDFFLFWENYKRGFGNFSGEFWLGLDHLHQLTSSVNCELLIELEDFDGVKRYARYHTFRIGNEKEAYAMTDLEGYSGDAGDSFNYHKEMKFTTRERDNDLDEKGNCAVRYTGAWWYNYCLWSNLNGRYLKGEVKKEDAHTGIEWYTFRGGSYSLKKTSMLIRPRQ